MRFWRRLPRDVMDAPSLKTFKVRLDQNLGNLMELWMSLCIAGELDYMVFKGPFQLNNSMTLSEDCEVCNGCTLAGESQLMTSLMP